MPWARHRASTCAASGPVRAGLPAAHGSDPSGKKEKSKKVAQLRKVELVHARRPHRLLVGAAQPDGIDRLVDQLRLPRIEASCRCVVRQPVADHGLERLEHRAHPRARAPGVPNRRRVVVVALDVVGREKPWMSGRRNVGQEHAGLGRGGVLVLVFLVEDTEGRLQVAGGQCQQRTGQRRFGDRLVDGGVIRGIDRDVVQALARDRSVAERIESAADRDTAVRREGQLLDTRRQHVPGLMVDLVIGTDLRVYLVLPVVEDVAGHTERRLEYFVVERPGPWPGFRQRASRRS